MNRVEFVITAAIILFCAFAKGWFANWLLNKFTRMPKSDLYEFEKMAHELHEDELTSKLPQPEAMLTMLIDGLRQVRLET